MVMVSIVVVARLRRVPEVKEQRAQDDTAGRNLNMDSAIVGEGARERAEGAGELGNERARG